MGAQIQTTLKLGRKSASGKALLETNEIIFRGEIRLKIAFKDITAVAAKDGQLRITYADGVAVFGLGNHAAKWADKIQNPKRRIDKLGIKPQHRIIVLNVKDAEFLAKLRARAACVSNGKVTKDADAIFLGASSLAGLGRMPELVECMKREGAIWTITPKGKSGIKDTDVMAAGKASGLVAVKVVSFSDTHSANKFVIPKADR